MGHMLVYLTHFAVSQVSYDSLHDSQCYSSRTVKTFLAFIAKLVDDCENSMFKTHMLTVEQLRERAKEDFKLGLIKLEQLAWQEFNALSSPQQDELHM